MALFETGQALQKKRLQELAASNAKIAAEGGRTGREKSNRALGGLLGGMLVGKAMEGDAGIGAGDIIAGMDKPPETAEDWAQAQKLLFEAGFEEEGLALTKEIKALQETSKGFAGKTTKPVTTKEDRAKVGLLIKSRAGKDSLVGSSLAPMFEDGATAAQQGQAGFFQYSLAEKASSIHQQLIDKGIGGVDKSLIVHGLLDELENTPGIINEETGFFGFFGEDAGVDTNALVSTLDKIGQKYVNHMVGGKKEDKPVEPAPHQGSTQGGSASGERQMGRLEQAVADIAAEDEALLAKDKEVDSTLAKVRKMRADKEAGIVPTKNITHGGNYLSSLQELGDQLNTNPNKVDRKSDIDATGYTKEELRANLIKALADPNSGWKAGDPKVQKMLRALYP